MMLAQATRRAAVWFGLAAAASGVVVGTAVGTAGCAAAATEHNREDSTRQMQPVPACIMRLPPRRTKTAGLARSLSEVAYWRLVFPTFDQEKLSLPENAIPCTGRNVLADPALTGGQWIRKYPLAVEEGELLLQSGGDRLKVLWLRTHVFPDGTEAGPLALVRPKEDSAEVYAVGVYRGLTKKPYFGLERIGPEVVITVSDEGCTGNTKVEPCRNLTSAYLPRKGELVKLIAFAAERRDYVVAGEPGAPGRIEYRMTSAARFTPKGITLFEQMSAKDEAGRELRRAEVERVFILRDVDLVSPEESLWPRIFPRKQKDDPATTDKPVDDTPGGEAGGGEAMEDFPPPPAPAPPRTGCRTCAARSR
jgi:hypothetical protein